MPGKQMAIDADLNAGLIDDVEARRRREDVSRESDFYGAMDGASKFVRGDAIAAIIMVVVNILGGFAVGMLIHHMELKQALNDYTMKTVGEGIVTQIPALIMSIATGLIVTRSTSKSHLSNDLVMQVLSNPHSLVVVAVIISLFAMVPGLPKFPILLVSGGLSALAIYQMRGGSMTKEIDVSNKKAISESASVQKAAAPEDMMNLLAIDPIEIEVGYGLVALADPMQGGDLLERITTLRKQIAVDHGFIVPPVRVRDNIQLKSSGYGIKLWDVEVAEGEILMRYMLAMKPGEGMQSFPGGIPTTEPAFGLPAIWVSETQKFEAEMAGFTVVDPTTVLITHLSEVIKNHAYEILSRQDVQMLVEKTRSLSSALVDDLIPKQLSLSELHRVLQNLLKERVPIRDLNRILTALSDHITMTHDIDMLTEYVRQSLARTITSQYRSAEGFLEVFTLEPSIEQMIVENLRQTQMGMQIVLDPMVAQKLLMKVKEQADRAISMGYQPILLCSTQIRPYFRKLIEKYMPSLIIISHAEIVPGVQVKAIGTVTLN
jgi:flagellar biosynthesis protein FlhA